MSAPSRSIIRHLREQDPLLLIGAASLLILVILAAVMLPLFVRTLQQRRGAEAQLIALQATIVQTERDQTAQPAILQQQIAEAENQIRALLTDWPTTEQATQELTRYYQYANELGIQLTRLEALPGHTEQDPNPAYRADRFLIEVHGPLPELLRFIARIGSHSYATFTLNSITIQPGNPSVGLIELAVFASDLSSGAEPPLIPTPAPTPTPTTTALTPEQQDEVLRLEVLMKQEMLQENWAAVIATGERILELSPKHNNARVTMYQAHVQWAKDLISQGERAEARSHYEAALLLVPDGEEALQGLQALDMEEKSSPTTTPQPETLVYTVRRGDSLSVIAERYGVTVQDLMTANNLRRTTIYVGQQLIIPLR